MSTREKIIVGLMCLTILYGAYEVLSSGSSKSRPAATNELTGNDLTNFVAEISKKLTTTNSERNNADAVLRAVSEWTKDPFIQSVQPLAAKPDVQISPKKKVKKSTPALNLSYSGFLQVGDVRLAIIDGLEYAEGDAIGATGYYIRSISEQRVILGQISGKEIVRLPLQEAVN